MSLHRHIMNAMNALRRIGWCSGIRMLLLDIAVKYSAVV